MALQPHQVEIAPEPAGGNFADDSPFPGAMEIVCNPVIQPLPVPADIAIPQQRDEIVAACAPDGVLKIDDSRGPGRRIEQHQIARVIIAMHRNLALGKGRFAQEAETVPDQFLLFGADLDAEPAAAKPLGEQ